MEPKCTPEKNSFLTRQIDKYLDFKASPDFSKKTFSHYRDLLLRFADFCIYILREDNMSASARDIRHEHLKAFLIKLREDGCAPSTTNNYASILKGFFKYLAKEGVIDEDPSAELNYTYYPAAEKDRIRRSKVFYTDDEIERTLAYLKNHSSRMKKRDMAVIALQLATSIRISEVCSLTVAHFAQMKEGHFECVCKGNVRRDVQIAKFAIPPIEAYLRDRDPCAEGEPLFLSQKGKALNRNAAWKALARAQRALGLRTGTHSYRRTAITNIAKQDSVVVAMRVAGHSSVAITNEYLLVSKAEEQDAVNNTSYANIFA